MKQTDALAEYTGGTIVGDMKTVTVWSFILAAMTAIGAFLLGLFNRKTLTTPKLPQAEQKPAPLADTAKRAIELGRDLRKNKPLETDEQIRARINAILADAARD